MRESELTTRLNIELCVDEISAVTKSEPLDARQRIVDYVIKKIGERELTAKDIMELARALKSMVVRDEPVVSVIAHHLIHGALQEEMYTAKEAIIAGPVLEMFEEAKKDEHQ